MKNKILYLISVALLVITLASSVYSQEPTSDLTGFDFNRAYEDYIFVMNNYRSAHANYVLAKGQYFSYGTLKSKNKALEETREMLTARADVVIAYITTLRMKLTETSGILEYNKHLLYSQIDDEVAWYNGHKLILSGTATLEDALEKSKEAENHYLVITEKLVYEVLTAVLVGKENYFIDQIEDVILDVKDKVNKIRQAQDKDTGKIERWIMEAETRILLASEKLDEIKLLEERFDKKKERVNIYSQIKVNISESHQYLKEANSFLKEIIAEVKIAD